MRTIRNIPYLIGLPLLLIGLWWVTSVQADSFFIPTPPDLVTTFVDVWAGERFLADVVPSVTNLLLGIALAVVLGVAIGLLIGSTRWLRDLAEPVLEFFRALPPPVLVPVLMLLVGVNDTMKIVVIVSGAIWPVLLNTTEGVRAVDSVLLDTARTYGISGWQRIRVLILPSAGPQIAAGIRQCLSIALILMVISEMFASSAGLGFSIVQFQRSFAIPQMWSGIVILGLIGIAMSFIFQYTERRVLAWYHGLKEMENAD